METWYFTFGFDHTDSRGRSLARCFVKLNGTFDEAREAMFSARGVAWAFQYSAAEFTGQVEKYGLREISLEELCEKENQQ